MKHIYLRDCRGVVVALATVSDEDYAQLSEYVWHRNAQGYAVRTVHLGHKTPRGTWATGKVRMHREIARPHESEDVDHINRDRLDNRRENLRCLPKGGNAQNLDSGRGSSRFRGVYWNRQINKWIAQGFREKAIYLGCFEREEDAAQVAAEFRRQHMPYSEEAAST